MWTGNDFNMWISVPPAWVVEPQSRAAKLGHQALLDCKVEGFPQPTVAWKKASGKQTEAVCFSGS
jgi:hypothetical protein